MIKKKLLLFAGIVLMNTTAWSGVEIESDTTLMELRRYKFVMEQVGGIPVDSAEVSSHMDELRRIHGRTVLSSTHFVYEDPYGTKFTVYKYNDTYCIAVNGGDSLFFRPLRIEAGAYMYHYDLIVKEPKLSEKHRQIVRINREGLVFDDDVDDYEE